MSAAAWPSAATGRAAFGPAAGRRRPLRGRWRALALLLAAIAPALCAAALLAVVWERPLFDDRLRPLYGLAGFLVACHVVLVLGRFRGDELLLPLAGALAGLGLALVTRLVPALGPRQFMWAVLGGAGMVALAVGPWEVRLLERYKYSSAALGIVLVGLTLVFGIDPNGSGARLWLGVGGLAFQPSEILKVLLVVFLAGYLAEKREVLTTKLVRWGPLRLPPLAYLAPLLAMWGLSLALLVWQRDLGAAILFFGVFLAMLYIAVGQAWYVAAGSALFLAGGVVCYALFAHVRLRVEIWLNPWVDPQGRSYQIAQALYSLAAGGVLGAGLGKGYPLYVPAAHTDFPFIALAEEAGLASTLAVLLLYALLVTRGLRLALRARQPFNQLLAAGLTAVIAVQTAVIVGGNLKLIPLTGVTLPFVSYGGSSLLANFLILGILLRLSHEEAVLAELDDRRPTTDDRPPTTDDGPCPPAATDDRRQGPAANGRRPREAGGRNAVMERQIQRVGAVFLFWFGALALGAGYWQVWRGPALAASPGNPRPVEAAKRAERGPILDRNGQILVETVGGERVAHRPALAHATGFYSLRYGVTGVERAYDGVLAGRQVVPAAQALLRDMLGAPRRGGAVRLTLDAGLQEVADRALGEARGAVAVVDVRTGALLAMLSKPYFDPGRVDEAWPRLTSDEARPLYNRVSQGLYVPGSTFKAVTATAALDAGLIQPSTPVSDPTGDTTIDGFRITDAERPPRPAFDFAHAFAWSSNVVFAQVGLDLGEARLREYAGRFGMGRALPFELETSSTSLSRTTPMPRVLLASTAFGQGELLMSPLQMALVAAAVARDGDVPRPYVVAEVRGPDGAVLRRARPESLGRAMSAGTARTMRQLMALAVDEGFARNAAIPGVRVGGKTGTAQSVPGMPDHSWFIGVAPVDQPRIAIAVLMEFSGWGSLEAAPVARRVLEQALAVS